MVKVVSSLEELGFRLSDLESMPLPKKVLVVKPEYFDVEYVINPHMKGHIGTIDKKAAYEEWKALKTGYGKLGLDVFEVEAAEGFPDMVFCANQSLPNISKEGDKQVLMSIMHTPQRKGEVPFIKEVYESSSYTIHHLKEREHSDFEGMGDALWHQKRRLIWGGYGYRSSLEVYDVISKTFGTPVIALELIDEKFYHLDTCLCILDEETALIYPKAFTEEGQSLIRAIFPKVIEANKHEAEELFACNATCADGKNVFIQQGCVAVNAELEELGFIVHEFSTNEYLKSGGSVFCMKMLLW